MKPCEPDFSLETSYSQDEGLLLTRWRANVGGALAADDREGLVQLFRELETLVAPNQVSAIWMSVVSGWDAQAVTG